MCDQFMLRAKRGGKEDAEWKAAVLLGIADIHIRQREYDKALGNLNGILQIPGKLNHLLKSTVFQRKAIINEEKTDYNEALEIFKGLIEDTSTRSDILYSSYYHIANIYRIEKKYDEALEIFKDKALPMAEGLGNLGAIAETFHGLANVYYDIGEYDKSLEFFNKRLSLEEQIGNQPGLGITLANIGKVLIKQDRYENALSPILRAYVILMRADLKRDAEQALDILHSIQKTLDYSKYKNAILSELKGPTETRLEPWMPLADLGIHDT